MGEQVEQVEHDRCGDDGDGRSCPICRGDPLDPDFVEMIERAAAQPGKAMSFDEAIEWLRTL
ncbi:MAG TPA: hypothetical protein VMQ93_04305 [Novosphingobium sp.]|nr:hypothetical protein [Novosphingobium sp.]